ncbi:ATP-binding protein [Clostridium algidicarnis]|uniref:DNA replication protein DnaC n=1 Tax=Clostridium algidicarnis DSM 15099 TaxID=1121295 RepID=A0A2S6FVS7_9CLOT|nr:ATP-binding protein [Clostridium algidicarnis]MBU3193371.1 ATP-binding protein [Clostridium algidicarnis]MBU3197256.1 ATP-binding protein [Clostridium algidicarnis]MBU3204724.1 ATP-binding protein [Clostridium algidicarnis]MBU3207514.1 ATP-binding protein [Clostridium algidicarnis]MBU3212791.1 ATP-binding protein [Clostridium algidicarnis]
MIKGYQESVIRIYENIQEEEKKALKKRRAEIEKRDPRILDIENKIGKLSVELAISSMKDIDNRDEYLNNLKSSITDLRVKKSEMLVTLGYSLNYLNLNYRCPKCKDTGFIGASKCTCYKQKLIQLHYKDSQLQELTRTNNFKSFDFNLYPTHKIGNEKDTPRKNIEKIYDRSLAYIDNFKSHSDNLLFYGNSGTGKTFLSTCIAKELLDKGYLVVYKTSDELIKDLRDLKFNSNKILEELIFNCDLLVIDDLGSESITDFTRAELFNLLNKRLLTKKRMIISTNLTLEQLLQQYSERITSRLLGNFDINKFYCEDIRVSKNLNKIT